MERVGGMTSLLTEKMQEVLACWKTYLVKKESIHIVEKIRLLWEKAEKKKEVCLVISYLRSSYITGSHKFKLAVYFGDPFIEPNPIYDYYLFLPQDIPWERDKEELIKILSGSFVRITNSEIEEIRRWYMEQIYKTAIIFFRCAVDTLPDYLRGQKIFYGEEMGVLYPIGGE